MNKKLLHPMRAAVLLLAVLLLSGCAGHTETVQKKSDILRLHVIANSDSAADQAVKLSVRDAILQTVQPQKNAEQTREYLMRHGAEILSLAEETLQKAGCSYGVQLALGTYDFPDRSYGDAFFPAGEYEALRVVLGDGAGQNWWCVLFPPLCIITEGTEPLPDSDEIVFHSSIWDWLQSRREK